MARSSEIPTAHRGAYLVESLFLLTILATAIALFMSMFAIAVRRGNEAARLDDATHIATNVAERFSADPTSVNASFEEDGYLVICDVVPNPTASGTLYRATISVWDEGTRGTSASTTDPIYTITTSRYVSEVV